MAGHRAFWVDDRYDRERGRGGGAGRYAGRFWDEIGEFDGAWGDIAPVTFCCAAWRVATPPVTDPGLVRWHRRILSAKCVRNTWDGSLTARVRLVAPLPAPLAASREWWRDRGWQGWPEIFGQFVKPAEQDLAKAPHLRATVQVDAPVPLDRLPAAPGGPGPAAAETAYRAVAVIVAELDELIAPIVARLESAPS
ncbi:hypothetical protein [Actinomadura rugatobispora]|uniref:Uncharacterized protein n=1 Tax=Actinomadura rugatobispora TaxID=1994 RepID=A0ABW1AGP3_9ACTN|nr:hypothetical protein GCM10010200_071360 [Actinomadura rugatobispora]